MIIDPLPIRHTLFTGFKDRIFSFSQSVTSRGGAMLKKFVRAEADRGVSQDIHVPAAVADMIICSFVQYVGLCTAWTMNTGPDPIREICSDRQTIGQRPTDLPHPANPAAESVAEACP